MEKKFEEIIIEGKKQGAPIEAINAELKVAGATFHLNPDGGIGYWTEEEMKSGFIPADSETPDALHIADLMKRDALNANKEILVSCAEGIYKITYDADGYAVKAVRVNV